MDLITILLIALALSVDAFAVSLAAGSTLNCFAHRPAIRVGLFFGGFQAIMPLIGWLCGFKLIEYINSYDHWIAFGLLAFIGFKMIYESVLFKHDDTKCNPFDIFLLFTLAVATSIDALAVGLSFSILQMRIITPVIIIGVVTFILSYLGVFLGEKFGSRWGSRMEVAGGIILLAIGVKILASHLLA